MSGDGGPAYPHLGLYPGADGNLHPTTTQHCGMTLRDWFAGQIVAGMFAANNHRDVASVGRDVANQAIAHGAYLMADAMLQERDR